MERERKLIHSNSLLHWTLGTLQFNYKENSVRGEVIGLMGVWCGRGGGGVSYGSCFVWE